MSLKHERLLAKGARLEKQQKLNSLETEIIALVSLIRMDLSAFDGINGMNIPRACESARRLSQLHNEYKNLEEILQEMQEDFPF